MRTSLSLKSTLFALLGVLSGSSVGAAVFTTDFNSGLPAGSAVYGTAIVDSVGGVGGSGALKLTIATGGQNGSYIIDDFTSGATVTDFDATFKAYVGGGTAADGFSFNFANDLPDGTFTAGEEGAGSGLTISFDTYANGGGNPIEAQPVIEVKWGGVSVTYVAKQVSQGPNATFVPVHISLCPGGFLTLTYNNEVIFSHLATGYTPLTGARFGFASRTGGSFDNHWIDDLSINANQTFSALNITGPANKSANEGQSATLSATIDSDCYSSAQWHQSDNGGVSFTPITGANSLSYTIPSVTLGMNGYRFKVEVVNSIGTAVSQEATLTVVPAPTLLAADSRRNPNGIFLFFSKNLAPASALNPANYTVSGGISVTGAVFNTFLAVNGSESVVMLQTTPAMVGSSNYTVQVSNVQDPDGNTVNPNPSTAGFVHSVGSVCYDFNSGLPAGTALFGANGRVTSSDGVGNSGALKLTDAAQGQTGTLIVNDFTGGSAVSRFRASFMMRLDTDFTSTPADGFSFNFANNLPNGTIAEEGAGNGLSFCFDNYDNGSGEGVGTPSPSFEIKWNGVLVPGGHKTIARHNYPAYMPVVLELNADGTVNLQVNNTNVFTNLATPAQPVTGGRFGLGARTGGAFENSWFDNLCISVFNGGPVSIAQQPASQTILEGRPVKVQARVEGSPPYFIQWYSNDVAIPGATSEIYTNTATSDLNGIQFKVVVSNEFSTVTSDVATLTVTPDTVAPVIISAKATRSGDKIVITFDEPLDLFTATDNFNYQINGVDAAVAALSADGRTVILTPATPLTPGSTYTLAVSGIGDIKQNFGDLITLSVKAWVITPGFIQIEIYKDISYTATIGDLTSAAKYPNSPDEMLYSHIANWRQPQTGNPLRQVDDGSLNYYGLRMSGFFIPRTSGDHTFYFVNDDQSQFRWSPDMNPANATVLFTRTAVGNLPFTALQSVAVPGLVAGQKYYFEALLKENTGGDYLTVGVREPGDPGVNATGNTTNNITPIKNFLLATLADPTTAASLSITQQPANATVTAGSKATFSVGASFTGNLLPFYQWKVNGTLVPGENGPTFTTAATTLADDGATITVDAYLPGVGVTSTPASLHVVSDTAGPQIVGSVVLSSNTLSIGFSEAVSVDAPAGLTDPTNYLVNGTPGLVQSVSVVDASSLRLTVGTILSGTTTVRASIALHDAAGNPVAQSGDVTGYSAAFTSVPVMTWTDIGSTAAPSPAGTVFTVNNQDFTVTAGGSDVWSGGDQFTYVYQQRTGDFDVRVRVDRIDRVGDDNSKAGLNIRDSLDGTPGFAARMAWMYLTPTNGDGRFQAAIRPEPGRDVIDVNSGAYTRWGRGFTSGWVRVKRVGKSFTYYNSYDGQNWNPVGLPQVATANIQNVLAGNNGVATASGFPDTLYVGLGTVSHVQGTPATAQFANFGDWSYPNATVSVTGNPLDATVGVDGKAIFKVSGLVSGAPQHELLVQWQRNGVDIPGAVSSYVDGYTYTTPPLSIDDNGAQYRAALIVSGAPRVYSSAATLTVLPNGDTSAPQLLFARRDPANPAQIILSFNKQLRPSSVGNLANYSLDQGATVVSAQHLSGRKVLLTTTGLSALSNVVNYALSVNGVQDGNGNSMVATNVTIPVYAAPRALMIVGNVVNINLSDIAISNRLDLLGYEVTPISATAANRRGASAANGFSLIYVSSTAGTAIGSTFRDVKIPTIVARRELFANYDMVPSNNATNLGVIGGLSQLMIGNAGHPLAAGLAAGLQTVVDPLLATRNFNFASNLPASAIIIGRLNTTTNTAAAHFGFENGVAMLNSRTTPSRRVGTYLEDNVAVCWHANGVSLFDASVRWVGMPSIIQGPASVVVAEGASAQLTVVAGTTTSPTYQWYKGGAIIGGATSEKLVIPSAQAGDAGNYTVVVGNDSGGSLTSAVAVVTVAFQPVITTQPQGQTNLAGANITFNVVATGNALSYQWRRNGAPISGATSATLSVTNAQPANAGLYTVVVNNIAGTATSAEAPLRILVPTTITNFGMVSGNIGGTIQTVNGLKYLIQATDDLSTTPITWTTLTTIVGDGSAITIGEPVGTGHRFYRIKVE